MAAVMTICMAAVMNNCMATAVLQLLPSSLAGGPDLVQITVDAVDRQQPCGWVLMQSSDWGKEHRRRCYGTHVFNIIELAAHY
jgi:hypothetical protein